MNEILDLLYKNDGHEPDWAAIDTEIFNLMFPRTTFLQVLKAVWAIYESDEPAEQLTLLHVLKEGPDTL